MVGGMAMSMKMKKKWWKGIWDFFFQSKEDLKEELKLCEKAHRNYLLGFANSPPFCSHNEEDKEQ